MKGAIPGEHGATSTDVTLAAPFPSWFLFRRWFFKKSHDITWNGIAKWRDSRKMDCWLQFSSEIPLDGFWVWAPPSYSQFLSPTMTMSSAQIQAKIFMIAMSRKLVMGPRNAWYGPGAGWGLGVGSMVLVYQTYATAECSDVNPISLKIYIQTYPYNNSYTGIVYIYIHHIHIYN